MCRHAAASRPSLCRTESLSPYTSAIQVCVAIEVVSAHRLRRLSDSVPTHRLATQRHTTHTRSAYRWHASLCAMRRQMPCACRLATPLCPPTDCVHSGVGAWSKHVPPSSGINVPAWCTYVLAWCTDVLATEPMYSMMYYSNMNA